MDRSQPMTMLNEAVRPVDHAQDLSTRSATHDTLRSRTDDSWVEISSQPSSSSLSSAADDIVLTGLKIQNGTRHRRRRTTAVDTSMPSRLQIMRTASAGEASSQEEYEESESESDRVMTSSGEGPLAAAQMDRPVPTNSSRAIVSDDEDENRTAINYPISRGSNFLPQPNAFSYPPSSVQRPPAHHAPSSYFTPSRSQPAARQPARHFSFHNQSDLRHQSHLPQNVLSPSYSAAVQHDEALRASLNSLLSVAAAARGHTGTPDVKRAAVPPATAASLQSNRVDPSSLRLVSESALRASPPAQPQEPTFRPTIRRPSINSVSTTSEQQKENKRKIASGRSTSRERRALKKARQNAIYEDQLFVSPTLMTWVVSAGVVVLLSALSFGAGYSIGREAGLLEANSMVGDEPLQFCAREASRSSLGLKRSLARTAIQV